MQLVAPQEAISDSFFTAVVLTPAKSLPAPGSVIAMARIFSPRHIGGRYLSFCSSEPNAEIGCITSDDCTLIAER